MKEHIRKFKDWQKRPHPIAPNSDEEHVCNACSTRFTGNYCPRCGQSHKVEKRMSLWKTFLLFIDVWGIGNRGMFHTLRDLILRPGYLICDYLNGRRAGYFPPFKLLFLLTALSFVVGSGFNIFHESYIADYHINVSELDTPSNAVTDKYYQLWNLCNDFQNSYPALFRLFVMTLTSGFYFVFFRKTRIGKLTYHEFFIAMVYMVNMANIYSIVFRFFGAPDWLVALPTFLYLLPLKQMTGYGWWNSIGRFLLSWLLIGIFFIIAFVAFIFILILLYPNG